MTNQPLYLVDAFTDKPFAGNPAGICPIVTGDFPSEKWMQSLAMEMNQAETAFLLRHEDGTFHLRWFTPNTEVDLCGHATLASAHILWETGIVPQTEMISFSTRSGILTATRNEAMIWLDFPAEKATASDAPTGLLKALGVKSPVWSGGNRMDWLVEVENEAELLALYPDMKALAQIEVRGIIVTTKSEREDADFLSRFFAPSCDVPEDPVTGSAHCCLAPYWSERLGKTELIGYQASKRGGFVQVKVGEDRVLLGGHATTILKSEVKI